jgi:hypothetical protein
MVNPEDIRRTIAASPQFLSSLGPVDTDGANSSVCREMA